MYILRLFWNLSWLVGKKPRSLVPKIVLDNVYVFHHHARLGAALLVLLLLRLGLLNRLCLRVDCFSDVVRAWVNQFVLLRVSEAPQVGI